MNTYRRSLSTWLAVVCSLIIAMVVIGGITRLTHSGLSIVDWNPIMGAIPPLNEAQWQEVFTQYQQFPQYQLINHGMSLEAFKRIFFWEYVHRLLGRFIGVAFLLPWLYFIARRRLGRPLALKLAFGFVLGGLQGVLGWYMVKSGLVARPDVSHYRLAAHLGLALLVLGYLFWLWLDLIGEAPARPARAHPRMLPLAIVVTVLLAIQIVYGAFTAGLKAGFGFNTFPMMNDEWFPSGFFRAEPSDSAWLNALENPIAVQFLHRVIGTLLLIFLFSLWLYARRVELSPRQRLSLNVLVGVTGVQYALGVTTLLLVVPVSVATVHQLGACFTLLSALWLNHTLRRE